jgi:hypothetical protein
MNKKEKNTVKNLLSNELIVDSEGRLRVAPPAPKNKLQQLSTHFSPSFIFLACGILAILLVDMLVFVFAMGLQQKYLLHNLEAKTLFVPFIGMLLLGITGSLSLLLFVVYKINLPYLQKGEVMVEVDLNK